MAASHVSHIRAACQNEYANYLPRRRITISCVGAHLKKTEPLYGFFFRFRHLDYLKHDVGLIFPKHEIACLPGLFQNVIVNK